MDAVALGDLCRYTSGSPQQDLQPPQRNALWRHCSVLLSNTRCWRRGRQWCPGNGVTGECSSLFVDRPNGMEVAFQQIERQKARVK